MLLLALETSCDETSAAVVRDGRKVLSNVITSQVDVHARFGGVVPELASRHHLQNIPLVIDDALRKADVSLDQIEGIAVTRGPGLVGALLVGISVAKGMAFARNLPLVGVHHIEGHILAVQLEQQVAFPYLALAVSGGHTHLYRVDGIGKYRTLGCTLDDAAGEAFDKVAKQLGLGYPGGPVVDRMAAVGDPAAIPFPRPMLNKGGLNFSFSGIKTAVMNLLDKEVLPLTEERLQDVCASFQQAVCDVLVAKAMRACDAEGLSRLVVAGGVACNRGLRKDLQVAGEANGVSVAMPSPLLCADNAAMLAVAGDYYLEQGVPQEDTLNALASWPLDEADRVGGT